MQEQTETAKIDWGVIIVVILGTFMAMLDSSIVNVGLPKMMAVFNASQDEIEWILTAYLLTLGVVMPVSGYLGDALGYKRTFISALILFMSGSALCGMAWNLKAMIIARIIQALGGGLMQPLGMALLFKTIPREKMGLIMGYFGLSAMVAPAIGPFLGGYLVDYLNWRMMFYINIPIGIINLIMATSILKETAIIKGSQFDKWGLIFSSCGFFCLLLGLSKAASKGWSSPLIIGLIVTAVLSLVLFVIVELKHPMPILELRVFNNYVFTISSIISCIVAMAIMGGVFLIPLFIQNVLGFSATVSGLTVLPAAVASGIMMPISGRIYDKMGARMLGIVGLAVTTFSTFMMKGFNLSTSLVVIAGWFALRSLGMGLCNMPIGTAGMNTVPPSLVGKASALTFTIKQVSASFGIAIFTTVLQQREIFHLADLAGQINLNSNQALKSVHTLSALAVSHGMNLSTMQSVYMSMIMKKISLIAAASSIGDCFVIGAILCLIAWFLSFFLKEQRKDN
jgi:DHA2 family multidrug resistance protein